VLLIIFEVRVSSLFPLSFIHFWKGDSKCISIFILVLGVCYMFGTVDIQQLHARYVSGQSFGVAFLKISLFLRPTLFVIAMFKTNTSF
jgi:hypothetical protein